MCSMSVLRSRLKVLQFSVVSLTGPLSSDVLRLFMSPERSSSTLSVVQRRLIFGVSLRTAKNSTELYKFCCFQV